MLSLRPASALGGERLPGHSISGMTSSPRVIYAGVGGQEVRWPENKRFRNGVVNREKAVGGGWNILGRSLFTFSNQGG